MTKEEKLRREGMSFAWHILESAESLEKGKELLKARLTRSEQTNCPCFVKDKALRDFEMELKRTTMVTSTSMALLVLRDKFSFGKERMERFMDAFIENADTIYGGWLEWNDILEYIKEQTGLDFMEFIKKAECLYEKTEEKLAERKLIVRDQVSEIPEK